MTAVPGMVRFFAIAAVGAVGLLPVPEAVLAKGGHGGHGGHSASHGSGKSGGAHSARRHRARTGGFIAGGAFAAGLYSAIPGPYSYYYGPVWMGIEPSPPIMYVERFPGEPTAETQDTVYCPERAATYPFVTTCPGGWQRVFTAEQAGQQAQGR